MGSIKEHWNDYKLIGGVVSVLTHNARKLEVEGLISGHP